MVREIFVIAIRYIDDESYNHAIIHSKNCICSNSSSYYNSLEF